MPRPKKNVEKVPTPIVQAMPASMIPQMPVSVVPPPVQIQQRIVDNDSFLRVRDSVSAHNHCLSLSLASSQSFTCTYPTTMNYSALYAQLGG